VSFWCSHKDWDNRRAGEAPWCRTSRTARKTA